jgi:hypothetical protein
MEAVTTVDCSSALFQLAMDSDHGSCPERTPHGERPHVQSVHGPNKAEKQGDPGESPVHHEPGGPRLAVVEQWYRSC